MAGTRIFNEKDLDQRWWKFSEQNKNCSCGPASVKIVKDYYGNKEIGEEAIRGLLGLIIQDAAHTGKPLLAAEVETAPIWDHWGTLLPVVMKALQSEPCRIPQARLTKGLDGLRHSTKNYPALLGFWWRKSGTSSIVGGGHLVVCGGPLKSNPDSFVILDPWYGLQYLHAADAVGDQLFYTTPDGMVGEIAPEGYIITTPL